MKPSPIQDAIGALKLNLLHMDHPTVIDQKTARETSQEAIARLQAQTPPGADQLVQLYTQLLACLPFGYLPHVTLTTDPAQPYATVITTLEGSLVLFQRGKTIDGITALIKNRFTLVGRGEAAA